VPGTPAGKGSPVCRPYGETHHPTGDEDQGSRTGAGRHARKRAAERFGAGVGAVNHWVKAYREGGMAALQPGNRNAGQSDKPAVRRDRDAGDAEALRRRVEEPEPGERVDAGGGGGRRKKTPGAGLRRLSNGEKTLLIDRPGTGSWRTRPNGAGTVPTGAGQLPRPATWPTGTSPPNGRTRSG